MTYEYWKKITAYALENYGLTELQREHVFLMIDGIRFRDQEREQKEKLRDDTIKRCNVGYNAGWDKIL